ncbi:hypothetical protein [Halobiforma nitratireducens]|nr:hypothetical protein [Halobiforma nitratireducens]
MRIVRSLLLATPNREPTVGEPFRVRVTDELGRPIADAVVESGSIVARTGGNGWCRLRFRSPGYRTVCASREATERVAFEPVRATLRVVPAGRPTLSRRLG